jgi:hypothetical protein
MSNQAEFGATTFRMELLALFGARKLQVRFLIAD